MSLWLYGRKRDGRRPLYSLGIHPTMIFGGLVAFVALLLPVFVTIRDWLIAS